MADRLKELGRFIDDMEGVRADLDSGRLDLVTHGLERLATMAREAADKFAKIPGMGRAVAFLRQSADDVLAERDALLEAQSRVLHAAIADYNKSRARWERESDKRREELRHEAEHGEQPDMFGNFTEKGR